MDKKVIIAMPELPLPFGNAAARWFYVLVKGLKQQGYKSILFASSPDQSKWAEVKRLFPQSEFDIRLFTHKAHQSTIRDRFNTMRQPFSYMFNQDFRRSLSNEMTKGFDLLHLEQLWSGWLGLGERTKALLNIHHLQEIDMEVHPAKSLKDGVINHLIKASEHRLIKSYTHIRSCSPRLVEPILKLNPEANVSVVPVGIDLSLYPFIPDAKRSIEPTITLIGQMSWYPSFSAAKRLLDRLWPKIKKALPAAKLKIIGWSARKVLSEYLGYSDVDIHENVPEIQPYFENASLFLYAPGRGSGMKIKIMEAMAFGVPIVTTSEGVEGLPAMDGIHAGIAEDDDGLVERTLKLLESPSLQNQYRIAAREMLQKHCGPEVTISGIQHIYEKMQVKGEK